MKFKLLCRNFTKIVAVFIFLFFVIQPTYGQYKDIKDRKVPCQIYNTTFTESRPVIDGKGDDEVWNLVEWADDFTQSIPKDGGKPSQKTAFKVLYDKVNLYFLVRAYDTEPEKIVSQLTRHDNIGEQRRHNCDDVEIFLSVDGDVASIINFTMSVSGSRADYFIKNYGRSWDVTYNPIWDGKTSIDSLGWLAEIKIPINQLNFVEADEYTWGFLVRRTVYRLQEENIWQWIPANSPGWSHLVGELHGIKNIEKKKHFELVPYASAKSTLSREDPRNPLYKTFKNNYNVGLDGKLGVSSNMTLDFTINPDFGQVESDPAVINLTAFESFFDEKRPFFLEGKDIFEYDFGGNKLFYSRRIGQTPTPFLGLTDNADVPDASTIINAVKLTGKTKNGLSIGILQSTTAMETAEVADNEYVREQEVAPLTSYFAARLIKDYSQGKTKIGGFVSLMNKFDSPKHIRESDNENAVVGGLDFLHLLKDKIYYLKGNVVASNLWGDDKGINAVRVNPVHYYNRFDNVHLTDQDTVNQLFGHGGSFSVGKLGTWQFSESFEWCSPGLDINDMGFQTMAEYMKQKTTLGFESFEQVSIFRDLFATIQQENMWDYYSNHLLSTISIGANGRLMNNYSLNVLLKRNGKHLNIRQLRGGPGLLNEGFFRTDFGISTDSRKKIMFLFYNRYDWSDDKISKLWKTKLGMELKISSNINIKADMTYTYDLYDMHYAETALGNKDEYASIVANLENDIWEFTVRLNYIVTPKISLQYYGNWLKSNPKFTNHRSVVNPQAENYNDRTISVEELGVEYNQELNTFGIYDPGQYHPLIYGGQQMTWSYRNPDFFVEQFRSNLVFRWEFKPKTTFFAIWSQDYLKSNRKVYRRFGDYNQDFYNYIVLKFSYFISR